MTVFTQKPKWAMNRAASFPNHNFSASFCILAEKVLWNGPQCICMYICPCVYVSYLCLCKILIPPKTFHTDKPTDTKLLLFIIPYSSPRWFRW